MADAETRVENYLMDDEEISYKIQLRPTGNINRIKSLLGFGVTHWFVTNHRITPDSDRL